MKPKALIWIVIVLVVILLSSAGSCGGGSSYDPDNWGAYYDWGEDHYWDSTTHKVETKPW